MVVGRVENVAPAEILEQGIKGVGMKVVISDMDGAPNFVMRVFEIEPGGHTPYHTHDWEHEVYVLEGDAVAVSKDGEASIGPGSVLLVEPNEIHNFKNTGDKPFVFLCMIPLQK